MKSYLEQPPKAAIVQNAEIYKRAEAIGYQDHDLNKANVWTFNLEENLRKQTNNKTSIYDFHAQDVASLNMPLDSINPDGLSRFQQQFLMLDRKENSKERLAYFLNEAERVY